MRQLQQNKILILFALIALFTQFNSCKKDDGIITENQAIIDDERIVLFLESHKIDSTAVHPSDHINWSLVDANNGDQTLADIAIRDSQLVNGIWHRYYYIEISEGKAALSTITYEYMLVDYKEHMLDHTLGSSSESLADADKLQISSRVSGLKTALKYFFTGIVQEKLGFNYRTDTQGPGRGIIILPSGLAYKDNGSSNIKPNSPVWIDLVLYDKTNN